MCITKEGECEQLPTNAQSQKILPWVMEPIHEKANQRPIRNLGLENNTGNAASLPNCVTKTNALHASAESNTANLFQACRIQRVRSGWA